MIHIIWGVLLLSMVWTICPAAHPESCQVVDIDSLLMADQRMIKDMQNLDLPSDMVDEMTIFTIDPASVMTQPGDFKKQGILPAKANEQKIFWKTLADYLCQAPIFSTT